MLPQPDCESSPSKEYNAVKTLTAIHLYLLLLASYTCWFKVHFKDAFFFLILPDIELGIYPYFSHFQ